jgi:hypothetical protein
MGLSAVSVQHSAKFLLFLALADSRELMADSDHQKTIVFGWALIRSNTSFATSSGGGGFKEN